MMTMLYRYNISHHIVQSYQFVNDFSNTSNVAWPAHVYLMDETKNDTANDTDRLTMDTNIVKNTSYIKLSSDSLIDTVFAIFGMTDFRIFEPRDVFACNPPPLFILCPSITPPIWNISLSTNVRKWGGVDSLRGTPIRLRKTGAAWLNAVRQTFASTQTVI